jgi:hypothetical protein
MLLWWGLLFMLCCKFPPASSTIADCELSTPHWVLLLL